MILFLAMLIAFLLAPTASQAQISGDPPTLYIGSASVQPQAPIAGQSIFLRFWTGPCVGIGDGPDETDITQDGSTITFIVDGIRWTNPTFCQAPFFHHTYPVGSYSAGFYTLIAQLRYRTFSNQIVLETFGTLEFEVTGEPSPPQPPEPVSVMNWLWLGVLLLAVLLLAARRLIR